MNQTNLILIAINDYMRERGYETALFFSHRVANLPPLTASPCVSIKAGRDVIGLRLINGIVEVYGMMAKPIRNEIPHHLIKIDVNDPDMFDIIEKCCEDSKTYRHSAGKD